MAEMEKNDVKESIDVEEASVVNEIFHWWLFSLVSCWIEFCCFSVHLYV